ncbi:MAG: hypothetical protein EWV89_06670 [Microcystis wesenbergii Mw_QC_B_20070930_S4]|jgi:hypothetical protein|nr:MAG: hypothetical protein EWV73_05475 [Microcystis wesenbergii Mw_QC_B_20070930_S4D]TRV15812.1 MAG: hypothetical protein EWV89_06670 [Microcystis wesenbergii Mw_QC_B_20070930_S4]
MKILTEIQPLLLITALVGIGCPVYGASLTVSPSGTQLDSDPINDLPANPGEVITFTVKLDTTGLSNPLKTLKYRVLRSLDELQLLSLFRSPEDISLFPIFSGIPIPDPNFSIGELTRTNLTGVVPGTILDLETAVFEVTSQVRNDGLPDRQFILLEATDILGNDVSSFFSQLSETGNVDVQPVSVPEPSPLVSLIGLALGLGISGLKR